jgi:hypothetical protein
MNKETEDTIKQIDKEISEINRKLRVLHTAKSNLCDRKTDLLLGIIKEYFRISDKEMNCIEIGYWDCPTSPIGVCFYNSHEDPCSDTCLVCGDPEERK